MNPDELVLSWLLWHQAVEFLKHDIPLMESADVRFPKVYADSLRLIGKQAFAKERETHRELRRHGVRILGQKTDRGEHFVLWRHLGHTELLRINEAKMRTEV
jgi:hypothetical protein